MQSAGRVFLNYKSARAAYLFWQRLAPYRLGRAAEVAFPLVFFESH
jgi:hypothetical protein